MDDNHDSMEDSFKQEIVNRIVATADGMLIKKILIDQLWFHMLMPYI